MTQTIEDLAHRLLPGAPIGDTAAADNVLRRHNVVGVFNDVDTARDAIARLEGIAGDGAHIQFVGFEVSTRDDREIRGEVDPEGVTAMAGRRIALGAVIGALVGGIVIGGLAYIVTGEAGAAVGAGIGGTILGVIGALLANFAKYGAGDAWRQTFQPVPPPVSLVAVLTDDPAVVAPAAEALHDHGALSVEVRDGEGERVPPGRGS
jgi:hypothetical protein